MMIRLSSALCRAVSGLSITKSKPLIRRSNFSPAALQTPRLAWCSICRFRGPADWDCRRRCAQAEEPLPVVFVTAHGDVSSSVRAMKRGAVDFLTKPVRGDELIEAVKRALARHAAEQQTRRQKREWRVRYESLTPREREVFALVVSGRPNKQIADVLGISERTVKEHRGRVMHKMGAQSPAELGRSVEWLRELLQAAPPLGMAQRKNAPG
jgi:FixJ family two-component response regulator